MSQRSEASRREFLGLAAMSTAAMLVGVTPASAEQASPPSSSVGKSGWVDHIPVRWIEPKQLRSNTNAVIWLTHLGGRKEDLTQYLQALASAGFLAVSFDLWGHGERGKEAGDEILKRAFGNFQRHMWPILGHSTLDSLRVIDWLLSTFPVSRRIHIGGISTGGDIAVAAAGLDRRIMAVAAMVATPDWRRPGMRDLWKPTEALPPGEPDAYAQYFYDTLDPMTHLERYEHGQFITFECAAEDTHVPPAGALRFKEALRTRNSPAMAEIQINLHNGLGHRDWRNPLLWNSCLDWFSKH